MPKHFTTIAPAALALFTLACAANLEEDFETSSQRVRAGLLCGGADTGAAGACNGAVSVDTSVTHTAYDIPSSMTPAEWLEDDYGAESCDCDATLADMCHQRNPGSCSVATFDPGPSISCDADSIDVFYVAVTVAWAVWVCDFDPADGLPQEDRWRPSDYEECTPVEDSRGMTAGWAVSGTCRTACSGTCRDSAVHIEDPYGDEDAHGDEDPYGHEEPSDEEPDRHPHDR